MNIKNLKLRKATNHDLPFVFNSFLKSYKNASHLKNVENKIFFEEEHKRLESILLKAECFLIVNKEDTSQIFGYIICDLCDNVPTLFYAYTKKPFRKLGIFKKAWQAFLYSRNLTEMNAGIYCHQTFLSSKILHKFNLLYHPYFLEDYIKQQQGG